MLEKRLKEKKGMQDGRYGLESFEVNGGGHSGNEMEYIQGQ
jgi:hypothetical protein